MQKTENYLIHLVFIGMIGMADAAIYLLLELLLDGNSDYYAQGSGSFPSENSKLMEKLVFSGRYLWYSINLMGILLLIFKGINNKRRKRVRG